MKKKLNKKIIVIVLSSLLTQVDAQIVDTSYISSYDTTNNFYVFKQSIYQSNNQSFKTNSFNVSNGLGLVLTKSKTDSLNYTHRKYCQTYNNIPIIGAEFFTHENSILGKYTANGKSINSMALNTIPVITTGSAINSAITFDGGLLYYWQDTSFHSVNISDLLNVDTTYYPKPQLVIINSSQTNNPLYKLAYKIRLYSRTPQQTTDYFVDANNGSLIHKFSISQSNCFTHSKINTKNSVLQSICYNSPEDVSVSCNSPCETGSADVKFYGSQYIYTDKFTYGIVCRYRPKNTCTGTYIYVQKVNGSDYRKSTNNWSTTDQSATSALFNFQVVHDFYRFNLNRNSFDDNYSQINIFPEDTDPLIIDNAQWTGSDIHIGVKSSNSEELIFFDVLGHEFTHGVTQYEAGLIYNGESGALNESFSDIFGLMVEYYGKQNYNTGYTPNYQLGEEVVSGGVRDMSNPNAKSNPDTYNGTFWASTSGGDNGGVHTNSGVQNFWFYLLSEGGSGTNDNNNNYCVKGIGRDKAAKITYRSLTTYLSSGSDYNAARYYSIQSAIDLYGANSNEVAQTTEAWYAVGVGPKYNGQINIQNITVNTPGVIDVHYNSKININNVVVNPGMSTTTFYVSSNTEIEMLPNTDFNNGVWAELYIAPPNPCSAGARLGNTNGGGKNTDSYNNTDLVNSKINNNLQNQKESAFNVQPNPNNGEFKLTLNNNNELPKSIIIRDYQGKEVKTINNPTDYELNIDLKTLNNGLFIITANYGDVIMSKRIIKQ